MIPNTNMIATDAPNAMPRSRFFNRKCPPPGISHASKTAGNQWLLGAALLADAAV